MMGLKRLLRILGWLIVLLVLAILAFLIDEWATPPKTIAANAQQVKVADGDSFAIGPQKLRLDGIDAPEYRQTCKDGTGTAWECGKAARTSLDQMLHLPGLKCVAGATDQYGRMIAICSAQGIADIGSAQVLAGMAVTHEYFGARDYGDQEDAARDAKRGIWIGEFIPPSEWRKTKPSI